MVGERAVLEVLAGVGEVDAEQGGVAAGAGVADVGAQPHEPAAEGDHHVLEPGVAAHDGVVLAQVHGVVVPPLQRHDREVGAVADPDLDVAAVLGRADVVEDDGGAAVGAGVDHGVAVAPQVRAVPGQGHAHRLVELGLLRHLDDQGLVRAREGDGGGAVGRHEGGADPGVVGGGRAPHHALGRGALDRDRAVVGGTLGEQRAHPVHRREPPVLLAARGQREVGDVERRGAVGARLVRDRGPGAVRVLDEPVLAGLGGRCCLRGNGALLRAFSVRTVGRRGGQPTAPSICSSIRRFSSRAYSIGSSRAIGSMKPRTIIAIASSSLIPRDIR